MFLVRLMGMMALRCQPMVLTEVVTMVVRMARLMMVSVPMFMLVLVLIATVSVALVLMVRLGADPAVLRVVAIAMCVPMPNLVTLVFFTVAALLRYTIVSIHVLPRGAVIQAMVNVHLERRLNTMLNF